MHVSADLVNDSDQSERDSEVELVLKSKKEENATLRPGMVLALLKLHLIYNEKGCLKIS